MESSINLHQKLKWPTTVTIPHSDNHRRKQYLTILLHNYLSSMQGLPPFMHDRLRKQNRKTMPNTCFRDLGQLIILIEVVSTYRDTYKCICFLEQIPDCVEVTGCRSIRRSVCTLNLTSPVLPSEPHIWVSQCSNPPCQPLLERESPDVSLWLQHTSQCQASSLNSLDRLWIPLWDLQIPGNIPILLRDAQTAVSCHLSDSQALDPK